MYFPSLLPERPFLTFLNNGSRRHSSCSNEGLKCPPCARRTPLHAAAFAEDVAGLQLVLRHGAEINTVDKSGRSALMVAADKGHSGTVGKSLPWQFTS